MVQQFYFGIKKLIVCLLTEVFACSWGNSCRNKAEFNMPKNSLHKDKDNSEYMFQGYDYRQIKVFLLSNLITSI